MNEWIDENYKVINVGLLMRVEILGLQHYEERNWKSLEIFQQFCQIKHFSLFLFFFLIFDKLNHFWIFLTFFLILLSFESETDKNRKKQKKGENNFQSEKLSI